MLAHVLRRTAGAVLTLLAASLIIFAVARLAPGSPEATLRGRNADPERIEQLRVRYGWDRPWAEQYLRWIGRAVLEGDLGVSYQTQRPVAETLAQRLPATVELTLAAMVWATLAGVAAGTLAALNRGSWIDGLAMTGSTLGLAVPVFFLGLLLLLAFPTLPIGSRLSPRLAVAAEFEPMTGLLLLDAAVVGSPRLWWDAARHLLLPAATLGTIPAAVIARLTRAAVLEVRAAEHVRTATAKGLPPHWIVARHILANAAIGIVTVVGLQLGSLLSGAVLTETVFSWPGLGTALRDACVSRDYELLQGIAMVLTAVYVGLNWLVDLSYPWLDPRLRES